MHEKDRGMVPAPSTLARARESLETDFFAPAFCKYSLANDTKMASAAVHCCLIKLAGTTRITPVANSAFIPRSTEALSIFAADHCSYGPMAEFRVFLSAVSSEFGSARDTLAASLRSRDLLLRVQSDFRQEAAADTTLRKLHDYIRDCSAVVCIIGERSGAMPPPASAMPFAHMLPSGLTEASYTQWEFFFARHYQRRLSLYIAEGWAPDKPASAGDRPELQAALIKYIVVEQGLDRSYFDSVDRLCHFVLKEDWPRVAPSKPIVLPYPSLGTLFKGRDDFIRSLRASLTSPGGSAVAIRAVAGMGGVGKSRAAVEYAWTHCDDYSALLWLEAETGERLDANLAALVGPLHLVERTATEQVVQVEAALAWLNANPGWLLILDNVDSDAALQAVYRMMGRISGGHVVLTSRLIAFPDEVKPLDLDLLTVPDAAALLLEASAPGRRPASDDVAAARELAEELGRLALALAMAAATIRARQLSFAEYRLMWRGNRARVVGWAGTALSGYHHAVVETWQTSVDQLTQLGRHLLALVAFMAPDPVPGFLLDMAVPGAAGEDATAALDNLANYSLVTRLEGQDFVMHRLVQDVTRCRLGAAGTAIARLTDALRWVDAAFAGEPQDVRNWGRLGPLAPHAVALSARADTAGVLEPTGRLMNALGLLFLNRAVYAQSETLLRRSLAIAEAIFGRDHPEAATLLSNLAGLLKETSRFGEAEQLMLRALAIDERCLGKNHPNVATDLNNLADVLRITNRLNDAEPLVRRALAIDEANLGEHNLTVANRINTLAQLLHDTNRLGEAEPLMLRAVAITEANLGKCHPYVARCLNNLAMLLHDTSRFGEAEPLMRRALAIDEASYGKDHPHVAVCLNNLGSLLRATNQNGEVEPLLRRALAIDEASFGEHHPSVAARLNNLALWLKETGRPSDAEPLMRRALAIVKASYGKEHPEVAICLNNLGSLLAITNRRVRAERLLRRALAIDEASFGRNHPNVARDLNNLGSLLKETGRPSEAEPMMRRALLICFVFQRDTGHIHPGHDAVFRSYTSLLAAMGRSDVEIAAAVAALSREA
jgi:tetratricopeptide (TPR) repeat protein